jgi:hypothetical protein
MIVPLFLASLAHAVWAIPTTISIQGSLVGTDGKALTGARVWRVQFYDAETGGNKLGDALAGSLQAGTLGHFSIALTPPAAVLSGTGEVWYEMAIDSAATPDGTIDATDVFPSRVAVHSVLFAQRAVQALTANTATTATVALKAQAATRALQADMATTATVAVRAKTLDGVPIQVLVTQDELTSALAAKAALAHSHNLDALGGAVTDAQVPDSITVSHAATATTATLAANAVHAQTADAATTATHTATATTATVALNAKTLEGVSVTALATDAELTSALATKANLAHSHNLDALGGAVTDAQVPDSITINHAATADSATTASFSAAATLATAAYRLQGETFLMVQTTSNSTTNADNLLATYAAARTRTPHGQPLSASNRIVVIVSPGQYDLGTHALTLDTEFVDVEGFLKDRDKQRLAGTANGAGTGVLMQTANDVRIENLFVDCTLSSYTLNWDATDPAAYFPASAFPATVVRNCRFRADDSNALSMRIGALEYNGTYEECAGGLCAFGGYNGTASGTFTRCAGGEGAFAGYTGTASGVFTDCTAGMNAFGHDGVASGTFTRCTAADFSFAAHGIASGIFLDCTGGGVAFGGSYGTASGTFIRCTGGAYAFGGTYGTANGTFKDCTAGPVSFGGESGAASGTFTNCTGGSYSFGGYSGAASGTFTHCTGGQYAFGGFGGTTSGTLIDCLVNNAYRYQEGGVLTVCVTTTPTVNAAHLLAAYEAAKTLAPNGQPLSASNRAVVKIPSGQYDLGTGALTLSAEFVDIEGVSKDRNQQHLYNASEARNTGVIVQTANNVRIENLFVECTRNWGSFTIGDGYDLAAYFPMTNLPATVIRNCRFTAMSGYAYSMRTGDIGYPIEYSGTYEDCEAGDMAFAGHYGVASGIFKNCTGGYDAFAGARGTASGTFINCVGLAEAFAGYNGTASGTFTNCKGDSFAFGGYSGTASGTFNNCTAGEYSFGSIGGTVSGTFNNCTGGNYAFGGRQGTVSGTFTNCKGGDYSFGSNDIASGYGTAPGGKFYYCSGGVDSFTTNAGTGTAPIFGYCLKNGVAFP